MTTPAGGIAYVLSRSIAGRHTPYRWLARAVSASANLILDIGCGIGTMSQELQRPDRVIFGLDLSREELQVAAAQGAGPWLQADALNIPFADESLDAITLSMGFGVIHNTDALLKEIRRVLKPGGVVAGLLPTILPSQRAEMVLAAQLSLRLRTPIKFPGELQIGFASACTAAGLTKVEDARQRYHYPIRSRDDVEGLIAGLDLDGVPSSRVAETVSFLDSRVRSCGELSLAVALRRVVAIK